MNILSKEFLLLSGCSALVVWTFSHWSKRWTILLANVAFLYLLKPSRLDLGYLLGLIVYCYLVGILLNKVKGKKSLILSAALFPALGLIYFKYNRYFPKWNNLFMPLGLSFYTFKAISYLVEIYRGKQNARNIVEVFDYIAFFPVFQAGPINRPGEFFEQLETPMVFDYKDQKNGCVQAGLGLFQKFVIADQLSHLTSLFLDTVGLNGFYTLVGMVLYAFQLYVDFDAYSNVAIGVSRMLGIHMKRNFHTPYLAVSVRDFWNRWHMSLSGWLQDYIYIPLGGSRKGFFRKCINVMVVFLVSGVWHGSTLPFVIWGIGHGILNIGEDILRKTIGVKPWMKAFSPFAMILNFLLVTVLWVPFRSATLSDATALFANLKTFALPSGLMEISETTGIPLNEVYWGIVLFGLVIASDVLRYFTDGIEYLAKQPMFLRWFFYFLLLVIAIIFGVYGPGYHTEDFIYVTF